MQNTNEAIIAALKSCAIDVFLGIETLLSMPVFLVSWWLCALYRAVIAGRDVSAMPTSSKQKILSDLLSRGRGASD